MGVRAGWGSSGILGVVRSGLWAVGSGLLEVFRSGVCGQVGRWAVGRQAGGRCCGTKLLLPQLGAHTSRQAGVGLGWQAAVDPLVRLVPSLAYVHSKVPTYFLHTHQKKIKGKNRERALREALDLVGR